MLTTHIRKRRRMSNKQIELITIVVANDSHVYASVDGNPDAEGAQLATRYYYTAGQKLQNFVDDVNSLEPQLVFFNGDIVEGWENGYEGSVELFMMKWNQINARKELTIGNHDLAYGGLNVANTDLANALGYGDRPIIAGSKYNQSFYLDNKVKIISFDTNVGDNGHSLFTKQVCKQPIRDWIESELLNSTTDNAILFSHASPADDEWHFNSDDSLAFKNMIDNAITQKPNLKIYSIAGHNHRQGVRELQSHNPSIKYYTLSPVVDYEIGKYTVVSFTEKDGVNFEEKSLAYPYPS